MKSQVFLNIPIEILNFPYELDILDKKPAEVVWILLKNGKILLHRKDFYPKGISI